jgi:hypothetical protein
VIAPAQAVRWNDLFGIFMMPLQMQLSVIDSAVTEIEIDQTSAREHLLSFDFPTSWHYSRPAGRLKHQALS